MIDRWIHRGFAFLLAALATGAAASLVQTQFNLAELVALGATVDLGERLRVSLADLVGFGPVMAGIAAAGLLPALMLASALRKWIPSWGHAAVFAAAGVVGLWVAFMGLAAVTPMRALVSATREPVGLMCVCAGGAIGGLVYLGIRRKPAEPASRRSRLSKALASACLLIAPGVAFVLAAPRPMAAATRADPASYRVDTLTTRLDTPWSVSSLPDGRVLVTEIAGRLLLFGADGARSEISLREMPPGFYLGSVAGLMEVTPDPAFALNGELFLTTSYGAQGRNGTRVVRGRLAGDRLVDVQVIFESTLKTGDGNNGGRMAFLPDGTWVLTVGDGSDRREQAQNLASHQGKMVRLDREGRPPVDNPYRHRAGALPELYSVGHRNAQGLAFDPSTGQLLSTEHGARGGDELNLIEPGRNFGWPLVTGGIDYSFARISPFRELAAYAAPLLQWTPSIAPAGLAVYRGKLFPGWDGSLLVPALKERSLRRVIRRDGRITGEELLLAELGERIRDVEVAADGSVYVLTDGPDARLLRLTPNKR